MKKRKKFKSVQKVQLLPAHHFKLSNKNNGSEGKRQRLLDVASTAAQYNRRHQPSFLSSCRLKIAWVKKKLYLNC